jgi:hypothetical protein
MSWLDKAHDVFDHRLNGLWLFVVGTLLVSAALLTYIYLLEGVLGTFSIRQASPTLLVREQTGARVAVLNSTYTRRAYARNNPQDTSGVWVDRALSSWDDLLLGQDFVGYKQIGDETLESGDLDGFDLLILPSTLALSDRQIEQIKAFLDRGGSVWASWQPGIYDERGRWRGWTFTQDVFGVSYVSEVGRSNSSFTVYTDTFPGYTPPGLYLPERPDGPGVRVSSAPGDSLDIGQPTRVQRERRRAAQAAGFAPLRGYLWMDSSRTELPRTDFALAEPLRTPLRGLDGELRERDAVAVTYYTWSGFAGEAPRVPYPSTSAGIRRLTLRSGTPPTGNIPAGYRAKVQVFTPGVAFETVGTRARPFAFWYDFATDDLDVGEALRTSTAAVYGTYGAERGRFVLMGFQRSALYIDEEDIEDQETFARLFGNMLRYLLREPVTWTHNWPAAYDAAALIAVVDEGDGGNAEPVADLLAQQGASGTYFVRADTPTPDATLARLAARGDLGVYADLRRPSDGPTQNQTRALQTMRERLEQRAGERVGGYRPSSGGIVDTSTLRALTLGDYDYFLPDSIGRRLTPKIMGAPNERLVRIGYTARSDRDTDPSDPSAALFLQDAERVAYEGSLYRLVLHTDGLATPDGLPTLSRVLRSLRDQRFWVASGADLAHWWRLREGIEVSTDQPGPNRVNLEITNLNAEVVRDLAVSLVPGYPIADASDVTVRSELVKLSEEIGARRRTGVETRVSQDGQVITLVLDQMRPQQTVVLQVNLCADEDGCLARLAAFD